jgi:hypothetical protein
VIEEFGMLTTTFSRGLCVFASITIPEKVVSCCANAKLKDIKIKSNMYFFPMKNPIYFDK